MEQLPKLIERYRKLNNTYQQDASWVIQMSSVGGRGLFANRDIKVGEVLFEDSPLLIGPRFNKDNEFICVNCFKEVDFRACSKNCGLPVCSEKCENSSLHKAECHLILQWKKNQPHLSLNLEVMKCLTPIRGLLLNDLHMKLLNFLETHYGPQHGLETNFLKQKLKLNISEEQEDVLNFICSVLDTNAFEVILGEGGKNSLRGIYPLSSLINHGCIPNIVHYFDCNQQMIVKAASFIPKGQELLHCYTKLFWGTVVRQQYLLETKHFRCLCDRCQDSTEFGTNLSAINCLNCGGIVLPKFLSIKNITWKCTNCKNVMPSDKATIILGILGNQLNNLLSANAEEILEFLRVRLIKCAPICNQIAVQLKCRLIWLLGHNKKYLWKDLSEAHLKTKESMCRELLELLEKLRAGQSKMRGLLLYELYCCLREQERRTLIEEKSETDDVLKISIEMNQLLEESKIILKDDVNAPFEIRNINKEDP